MVRIFCKIHQVLKLTYSDSALIGAPVVAFVDESIDALRVMRTPAFFGTSVSVASHDTVSNTQSGTPAGIQQQRGKPLGAMKNPKVPRPPNAFILYRQHHHPEIKAAYPDFHNNDICKFISPDQTC